MTNYSYFKIFFASFIFVLYCCYYPHTLREDFSYYNTIFCRDIIRTFYCSSLNHIVFKHHVFSGPSAKDRSQSSNLSGSTLKKITCTFIYSLIRVKTIWSTVDPLRSRGAKIDRHSTMPVALCLLKQGERNNRVKPCGFIKIKICSKSRQQRVLSALQGDSVFFSQILEDRVDPVSRKAWLLRLFEMRPWTSTKSLWRVTWLVNMNYKYEVMIYSLLVPNL